MKKIILFIGILLFFVNCSSDDSNNGDVNAIIGTWKIQQKVNNGQNISLRQCQELDYTEVRANKTFQAEYYEMRNNQCKNTDDSQGTWEHTGGNKYNLFVGTNKRWLILIDSSTLKLQEDPNNESSYELYKLQ